MASFNDILNSLHKGITSGESTSMVADQIVETNIIEINAKRQFIIPSEFDTIIAYEGDVNSQIITFKLPESHEGHKLIDCANKKIRWVHQSIGLEGESDLKEFKHEVTEGAYQQYYQWEVPSALFVASGNIEIWIEIYDLYSDNNVAFSWNTATYSGLSVGKTGDKVRRRFPPKNEILIVDKETRNIVAPPDYNNIVCNYGDVGTAEVYFLINRFLGKNREIDLTKTDTVIEFKPFIIPPEDTSYTHYRYRQEVHLYIIINGNRWMQKINAEDIIAYTQSVDDSNSLVLMKWELPSLLTCKDYGPCGLEVSIGVSWKEEKGENLSGKDNASTDLKVTDVSWEEENVVIVKRWFSNAYSQLKIGESLINKNATPGDIVADVVYKQIEEYFAANDIIWDANKE